MSVALRASCDVSAEDVTCCGLVDKSDVIVGLSKFCNSLGNEYSLEDLTYIMGKYVGLSIEPSAPLPNLRKENQELEVNRLRTLNNGYISCFSALAERASINLAETPKIELSRKSVEPAAKLPFACSPRYHHCAALWVCNRIFGSEWETCPCCLLRLYPEAMESIL